MADPVVDGVQNVNLQEEKTVMNGGQEPAPVQDEGVIMSPPPPESINGTVEGISDKNLMMQSMTGSLHGDLLNFGGNVEESVDGQQGVSPQDASMPDSKYEFDPLTPELMSPPQNTDSSLQSPPSEYTNEPKGDTLLDFDPVQENGNSIQEASTASVTPQSPPHDAVDAFDPLTQEVDNKEEISADAAAQPQDTESHKEAEAASGEQSVEEPSLVTMGGANMSETLAEMGVYEAPPPPAENAESGTDLVNFDNIANGTPKDSVMSQSVNMDLMSQSFYGDSVDEMATSQEMAEVSAANGEQPTDILSDNLMAESEEVLKPQSSDLSESAVPVIDPDMNQTDSAAGAPSDNKEESLVGLSVADGSAEAGPVHMETESQPEVSPPPVESDAPLREATPPPGEATPPKEPTLPREPTPPPREPTPPPKEATPPPREPTPPPREPTPPPKEPTPPPREPTPPPREPTPPPKEPTPPPQEPIPPPREPTPPPKEPTPPPREPTPPPREPTPPPKEPTPPPREPTPPPREPTPPPKEPTPPPREPIPPPREPTPPPKEPTPPPREPTPPPKAPTPPLVEPSPEPILPASSPKEAVPSVEPGLPPEPGSLQQEPIQPIASTEVEAPGGPPQRPVEENHAPPPGGAPTTIDVELPKKKKVPTATLR